MPASATLAMLLADARLPAGAHVSSGALEAALRSGMPREEAGAYMATRMRTVVRVEAGTAVVTRHRVLQAEGSDRIDLDRIALAEIIAAWEARTPGRAQRDIARVLGAGLLRLAGVLWPDAARLLAVADAGPPRPVVLGAIAAQAGLGAEDLVRLIGYDDAQTVASALLKLEPGDPLAAAALVLEACADLEAQVDALSRLTSPEAIPAAGAPQIEAWAEAQAVLPRRLFRA